MQRETTPNIRVEGEGKKLTERIPFVWKRSINKLIKKDPNSAIKSFIETYQSGEDLSRMKYGLVQTLPNSLISILSFLVELEPGEEKSRLLSLLIEKEFLPFVEKISIDQQKVLLIQVFDNWGEPSLDRSGFSPLLNSLDSELLGDLIPKLAKDTSDTGPSLLRIWGPKIASLVLSRYITNPQDVLTDYLLDLSTQDRVKTLREDLPLRLSPKKTELVLNILETSDLELRWIIGDFLKHLTPKSRKTSQQWLIDKNIPIRKLVQVGKLLESKESRTFLAELLGMISKHDQHTAPDVLAITTNLREYELAKEFLSFLDKEIDFNACENMLEALNQLDESLKDHMEFLQRIFIDYGHQNIPLVIDTYFQSDSEEYQAVLLPVLQDQASRQGEKVLEFLMDRSSIPDQSLLKIFDKCPPNMKFELAAHIIENNWLKRFHPLFTDFNFFQAILLSSKPLPTVDQAYMDKYLEEHISSASLGQILDLSTKITYPLVAFATIFENNPPLLKNVIETLARDNESVEFWAKVLIANIEDALPYAMNVFLSRKQKKGFSKLLELLINEEPMLFWVEVSHLSSSKVGLLRKFYAKALLKSVPNFGLIMNILPPRLFSQIWRDNIQQIATEKGSSALYSLFGGIRSQPIPARLLQEAIVELVKHDLQGLLGDALLRCSKLQAEFDEFSSSIVKELITSFPEDAIKSIDNLKLNSLTPRVENFILGVNTEHGTNLLYQIIPALTTEMFYPLVIGHFLNQVNRNSAYIAGLITVYEENYSRFTPTGVNLIQIILKGVKGTYHTHNVLLKLFIGRPQAQGDLLPGYLVELSLETLEQLLLDPEIGSFENSLYPHLFDQFKTRPPPDAASYFINLYQRLNQDHLKTGFLPVLAEYLTWQHLPVLMKLPEDQRETHEYQEALSRFAARFEISSANALREIWQAGLNEIYEKTTPGTSTGLTTSRCPSCGQPVLEGQKNCGFCPQRLTCLICRKSVVVLSRVDIIQCPRCNSFFHRDHLLESVKLREQCPNCNASLTSKKVNSLPKHQFSFI
ncbi:MAG: hypothetical protein ACFFE8_10395 [Candidatus Heimdallarchaeota archaeon]